MSTRGSRRSFEPSIAVVDPSIWTCGLCLMPIHGEPMELTVDPATGTAFPYHSRCWNAEGRPDAECSSQLVGALGTLGIGLEDDWE